MDKREPIHSQIYEDTLNEFTAKENQSFSSIQVEVESEYLRRVQAYLPGEPAFSDDPASPAAMKKRNEFKNKKIAQGRLPKTI